MLASGQLLATSGRQRRVPANPEVQRILPRQCRRDSGIDQVGIDIAIAQLTVTVPVVIEIVVIAALCIMTIMVIRPPGTCIPLGLRRLAAAMGSAIARLAGVSVIRSEEHTYELQSLMRISYAV